MTHSARRPGHALAATAFACAGLAQGLAGAGVLVMLAEPALAQPAQKVEPYWVVVTADNLPLKAGAGLPYYPVRSLKSGDLLKVDAQVGDWLRVHYPAGVPAFVKAEEARPEPDGSSLTLAAPSQLMAANASGGERANWWTLLETPVPAGTRFQVLQTLKTADGKVYGYLVPAPPEARGYVKPEATRRATPAEAAGAEGRPPAADTPAGTSGVPAPRPGAPAEPVPPAPSVAAPPRGAPAPANPDSEQLPGPVRRPLPPPPSAPGVIDLPSTPGGSPAGAAPGGAPAPGVIDPAVPPTTTMGDPVGIPAPARPQPAPPREPDMGSIDALASLYEQVRTQPIREAELGGVIAEFEKAIGALGSGEDDRRTAEFLRARLEVLRIRSDLQESLRSAAESRRRFERRGQVVLEQAEAVNRVYAVVGTLLPSTVYDGTRLPKMFRIVSVDAGFPRTLAYVAARGHSPGQDDPGLEGKIGRVVGVEGEARYDESLRLNIITPTRVDLLRPTDRAQPRTPAEREPDPAPAGTAGDHDDAR
ncbi:MAG TPA: SH3 domain-containing protein [Phycisphaerales bacterium]|nr:SH3 domain-containing protein [Phycisphaerales bacterium]